MTTKNTGGPAFPHVWDDMGQITDGGMTLRDYFAGQAMTGWLASYQPGDGAPVPSVVAEFFYSLADAMLAEREK